MYITKEDAELINAWLHDTDKDPQTYLIEYEWLESIIPKMFAEILWLRRRQDELLQMMQAVTNHTKKPRGVNSDQDDDGDTIWIK